MTLKGGGATVMVDGGGVTILGALVFINEGGSEGVLPYGAPAAPSSPKTAGPPLPPPPE